MPDYARLSMTGLDGVGSFPPPSDFRAVCPFNSFSSFNPFNPGPLLGPPPLGVYNCYIATTRINIGSFSLLQLLHTDKHWSKLLFLDQNIQNPEHFESSPFIGNCYIPATTRNKTNPTVAIRPLQHRYYVNLEDPNERGYDVIRRLFLIQMAKTAGKSQWTVQN
jgi:hypothetical protein